MARDWGYWTVQKLEILRDYLPAFTTASKRAGATVYLDLFAGAAENVSRDTGEIIDGSPRIALATRPEFTKVALFELPAHAPKLEAALRATYPARDFTVWSGDCNEKIDEALHALANWNYAATFALIDQYAAEIHWDTLKKLSAFKKRSNYKVEIWLLFAHAMLPRGLAAESEESLEAFASRLDAMYGSQDWVPMYNAWCDGTLDPADFREELLNLMRWRLEKELGYARTHAVEMKNTSGVPIYSMVFATDNAAGEKIMSDLYAKAAQRQPELRAEAVARKKAKKDDDRGILSLFEPLIPKLKGEKPYVHQPPFTPYGMQDPS
jgi:three-Cys-motif partner protein